MHFVSNEDLKCFRIRIRARGSNSKHPLITRNRRPKETIGKTPNCQISGHPPPPPLSQHPRERSLNSVRSLILKGGRGGEHPVPIRTSAPRIPSAPDSRLDSFQTFPRASRVVHPMNLMAYRKGRWCFLAVLIQQLTTVHRDVFSSVNPMAQDSCQHLGRD